MEKGEKGIETGGDRRGERKREKERNRKGKGEDNCLVKGEVSRLEREDFNS